MIFELQTSNPKIKINEDLRRGITDMVQRGYRLTMIKDAIHDKMLGRKTMLMYVSHVKASK